jgi:hypothetical protein
MQHAIQPTPAPALTEDRESMALKKLVNLMGQERGYAFYLEVLDLLALKGLATPNDSVRFGEELISRGGVLASIGRSIKIQAILHGAQPARSA